MLWPGAGTGSRQECGLGVPGGSLPFTPARSPSPRQEQKDQEGASVAEEGDRGAAGSRGSKPPGGLVTRRPRRPRARCPLPRCASAAVPWAPRALLASADRFDREAQIQADSSCRPTRPLSAGAGARARTVVSPSLPVTVQAGTKAATQHTLCSVWVRACESVCAYT